MQLINFYNKLVQGVQVAQHSYEVLVSIERRLAAIERLLAEQNVRSR